ncbi:MAG: hypothetical protein RR594_03025 [Clostridia bacterium]
MKNSIFAKKRQEKIVKEIVDITHLDYSYVENLVQDLSESVSLNHTCSVKLLESVKEFEEVFVEGRTFQIYKTATVEEKVVVLDGDSLPSRLVNGDGKNTKIFKAGADIYENEMCIFFKQVKQLDLTWFNTFYVQTIYIYIP